MEKNFVMKKLECCNIVLLMCLRKVMIERKFVGITRKLRCSRETSFLHYFGGISCSKNSDFVGP